MKKKERDCILRKRKRRRGLKFGMARRRISSDSPESNDCDTSDTEEKFGFQTGSDFTLEEFEKYAVRFKERYFKGEVDSEKLPPSVEEIEGEYWRIVEKLTKDVEVRKAPVLIFSVTSYILA